VIREEVNAYDAAGTRGIRFVTDWQGSMDQGQSRTSLGTYIFGAGDINGVD
jgi:hypothetical protein